MEIPSLPHVPIDMETSEHEFLKNLEGKLDKIDVLRLDGDDVHILGSKKRLLFKRYYEITKNRKTGQITETSFIYNMILSALSLLTPYPYISKKASLRRLFIYDDKVSEYSKVNLKEIKEKIKDIKVYQGTIEEVQSEIKRPLERVDTGKPETFLQGHDVFWLRVQAYLHGADAIVHYQPGSSIGTPVRYAKK